MATHALDESPSGAFKGAVQRDLDSFRHQLNGASGAPASVAGLIQTEAELASLAAALGAESVGGLDQAELRLLASAPAVPRGFAEEIRARIQAREDPLGEAFLRDSHGGHAACERRGLHA